MPERDTVEVIAPPQPESTNAQNKNEQKDRAIEVRSEQEDRAQDQQLNEKEQEDVENGTSQHQMENKPYSVFSHNEKRLIIICCGLSMFFSPVSGQIYFPSLPAIAADLNVSMSLVNLTITSYLILQGIAPAFVGGFSDSSGRRPAYFICFVVYCGANLGLALQNDYATLIVLRCLQSAGSSGTVALASAVVADVVTSAERGVYVSYISVGSQAGPSLGPIIGGLLGQYLGWHSIFWFLLIATGVVFIPSFFFLAETCRTVVDDGSVPPPKLRRCYTNHKVEQRLKAEGRPIPYAKRDELARNRKLRFPNPLESVKIVFTKEAGFMLFYIGMLCCCYYATVALIPSQFHRVYGFNQLQIALCYLPLGFGSLLASFVRGRIIDANYKAHAKRLNFPLEYNRRVDLSEFPIERARLEVAVPTIATAVAFLIGFGWMIDAKVHLAGPLVFLFVIGFCVSASLNTFGVLLVDLYPGKAGTAAAANNLVRCGLGAGATSAVQPLIDAIGIGWTITFFAGLVIAFSPIMWYVMKNGPKWRRATKERRERELAKKEARRGGAAEGGK
ncbi:MFS general substrate transporter [Lophiostoma macrostomum CBS 122681]|uniref:MFS general substrate transporter n=1 Tax=Lophiostoma macrostomum CBS 122681 TaxID=1314788 RepID=A0A6A6TAJ8_9PLEO|nr:MFS general substrate transporter [Lophiostoma macrostomum CBS 122681]